MKKFLAHFNGGYLWFGTNVHVTVDLIYRTTSLPNIGVDTSQYFCEKYNDKKLVARLWNKYDVVNGKWAYVINTINEKVIHVREMSVVVNIVWKDLPY